MPNDKKCCEKCLGSYGFGKDNWGCIDKSCPDCHSHPVPPQSVCCINCKNPTNFANECCNRDCPCHQPSTPKEECGHHCHEDGRISHCDTCQPQAPQPKEECKHLNTIGYERPNERCLDCGTDLKAPHTAGSEWEKELDKLWLLIPLGNVGKDDFKFLIKKLLASEREKWVINESAEWVKSIELKARSQVLDEAVEATRKIKLAPVMWEGEELLRKYEVLDLLLQLKGQDK